MDFEQDTDNLDDYYAQAAVDLRVPKKNRALFIELAKLLDSFCEEYLDEEYYNLCIEVAGVLCRSRMDIGAGRLESWASGIVHAVGWVNFLFDPDNELHIKPGSIAKAFSVSQNNMTTKSKTIRDKIDMIQFDPRWCHPDLIDDNPLVWMFEVDGIIIDLRYAPREVQEKAYEMGIIPYIPVKQWAQDGLNGREHQDEREKKKKPDEGPNIIEFPSVKNSRAETESADKGHNDGPGLFDDPE